MRRAADSGQPLGARTYDGQACGCGVRGSRPRFPHVRLGEVLEYEGAEAAAERLVDHHALADRTAYRAHGLGRRVGPRQESDARAIGQALEEPELGEEDLAKEGRIPARVGVGERAGSGSRRVQWLQVPGGGYISTVRPPSSTPSSSSPLLVRNVTLVRCHSFNLLKLPKAERTSAHREARWISSCHSLVFDVLVACVSLTYSMY